ncbi:MAG: CYTH domain-containing protein [Bacteroidota bacterium]|nr:CYTH domain-containing protein [Bacteroidota bacterium]
MIEIERKFLVDTDQYKEDATKKSYIVQGFLNSNPARVVRIRIKDDKAYITVKGRTDASGLSRFEWEKEILVIEAKKLLTFCEEGIIEKYRYEVEFEGTLFEVDEFMGNNQGLVIAEVELNNPLDTFNRPTWLGKEVTGDAKYYNSNLISNPYTKW